MTEENKLERRDFSPWVVDVVYAAQEGICAKANCGKSLSHGFHRHHKDGNPNNNSVENLELFCPECHGGEMFQTLRAKKIALLGQLQSAIDSAIQAKMSGTSMEKILDGIKLALSLTEQTSGLAPELPPPTVQMTNYLISSGILVKEKERGIAEGIQIGLSTVNEAIRQYMETDKKKK
jgi:cytochrome c553